MAWSLKPINPVGKILGKKLVKDKYTKNKSGLVTPDELENDEVFDRYAIGLMGNTGIDRLVCPNCGRVMSFRGGAFTPEWSCSNKSCKYLKETGERFVYAPESSGLD